MRNCAAPSGRQAPPAWSACRWVWMTCRMSPGETPAELRFSRTRPTTAYGGRPRCPIPVSMSAGPRLCGARRHERARPNETHHGRPRGRTGARPPSPPLSPPLRQPGEKGRSHHTAEPPARFPPAPVDATRQKPNLARQTRAVTHPDVTWHGVTARAPIPGHDQVGVDKRAQKPGDAWGSNAGDAPIARTGRWHRAHVSPGRPRSRALAGAVEHRGLRSRSHVVTYRVVPACDTRPRGWRLIDDQCAMCADPATPCADDADQTYRRTGAGILAGESGWNGGIHRRSPPGTGLPLPG